MQNPAQPSRNQPCPCGSGKKLKYCHPNTEAPVVVEAKRSSWKAIVLTAVVLAGLAGLAYQLGRPPAPIVVPPAPVGAKPVGPSLAPQPVAGNPAAFTPPPPGPAPAGKVWSPEHGHWHDTGAAAGAPPTPIITGAGGVLTPIPAPTGAGAPANAGALTPQPGEAPPGKVWSPEHGHWHDLPGAGTPALTPAPAPAPAAEPESLPAPAPETKPTLTPVTPDPK